LVLKLLVAYSAHTVFKGFVSYLKKNYSAVKIYKIIFSNLIDFNAKMEELKNVGQITDSIKIEEPTPEDAAMCQAVYDLLEQYEAVTGGNQVISDDTTIDFSMQIKTELNDPDTSDVYLKTESYEPDTDNASTNIETKSPHPIAKNADIMITAKQHEDSEEDRSERYLCDDASNSTDDASNSTNDTSNSTDDVSNNTDDASDSTNDTSNSTDDASNSTDDASNNTDDDTQVRADWRTCTICDKKLHYKSMRFHMKRFHPGCSEKCVCAVCDNKYEEQKTLKTHIRQQHAGQCVWLPNSKPFGCPFCLKKCKLRSFLAKHIRLKHGGQLVCCVCGKMFVSQESHSNHMVKVEGWSECPVCNRLFSFKISLTRHMLKTHNMEAAQLPQSMD
jgi:uncharacterized C2H2 Zn-finger protein